jgi:hypothetical protein
MPNGGLKAGQTFYLELPDPGNPHLFIIVLDRNPITDETLIVPIDKKNFDRSPTVEFNVGDHSRIRMHSFVTFKYLRKITSTWLYEQVRLRYATQYEDISATKLQEIREKMTTSRRVKDEIRQFYIDETWKRSE